MSAQYGNSEAEQIVHITFQGVELALRLTGSGIKNLAQLIYAASTSEKNLNTRSGEVKKVAQLLRENKPLKTYKLDMEYLRRFRKLAKQYGVLYTVVKDKMSEDGMCTVILKQEEVPMLNKIIADMGFKDAHPIPDINKKKDVQSKDSLGNMNKSTDMTKTLKIKEALDAVNSADKSKITPEHWKIYLSVQSLLHNYSDKNKDLILNQMPDASVVMSKSKWRELGRFPDRNSKGIKIIRPEVIDGKKTENFTQAIVYDISQTYGRPIRKSELAVTLKEGSPELASSIDNLKSSAPVPIEIVKDLETNGVYDKTQGKILIRDGLSQTEIYKEIVQESAYANAHIHHNDNYIRSNHRLAADSTAFALMDKNGLDTSSFDFGYIKDIDNIGEQVDSIKASVSNNIAISEKSLEKFKTKEKNSTLGKLMDNNDKARVPEIKIPKKEISR